MAEAVAGKEAGFEILRPPARLETFGFDDTAGEVEVIARSQSWRVTRALLSLLIGWGLVPVVALLPPHIPWAVGAFIAGPVLAVRRMKERYTLKSGSGRCPKCGASVTLHNAGRLHQPHPVQCASCAQDLLLRVRLGG